MKRSACQACFGLLADLTRGGVKLLTPFLPRALAAPQKQDHPRVGEIQSYSQAKLPALTRKPRKARLLWWLPLPLIPATVIALASGQFIAFVANAGAYGLFLAGSILTHRGFDHEVKQERRQFQATSPWPLKTLGGLTIALATALTAWAGVGHGVAIALAFGGGAFAAFVLLYGLDSARRTEVAGFDQHSDISQINETLRLKLRSAEEKIESIEQASSRVKQPELNQRLTRIVALARNILLEIANDPRDLHRARKFLNIYLDGAQRVVSGYAKAHANLRSQTLEDNFRRVLITIEEVFERQHQHLLENDLRDLDVEMEVLATQLKHEGLN